MSDNPFEFSFLDSPDELDSTNAPSITGCKERPVVRLSHSSRGTLHSCERKYYLTRYKLLDSITIYEPDTNLNNTHLDFGTALGAGIQQLLISEGDIQSAVWTALQAFNYADETPHKSAVSLVHAIHSFHDQWQYDDWEVAYYINSEGERVPAAELSFKIILDQESGDYTCGYMDLVLIAKASGLHTVVEIKTTGLKISDLAPLYANSDQGVGYSVILDSIAEDSSTYHVLYLVVQFKSNNLLCQWHFMPFHKTKKDRLEFLLTQQMDYQYLKSLEEIDYWPKRGNACVSFGKVCSLYGVCHLATMDDLPFLPPKPEDNWTFTYNLSDLIERQMQ